MSPLSCQLQWVWKYFGSLFTLYFCLILYSCSFPDLLLWISTSCLMGVAMIRDSHLYRMCQGWDKGMTLLGLQAAASIHEQKCGPKVLPSQAANETLRCEFCARFPAYWYPQEWLWQRYKVLPVYLTDNVHHDWGRPTQPGVVVFFSLSYSALFVFTHCHRCCTL